MVETLATQEGRCVLAEGDQGIITFVVEILTTDEIGGKYTLREVDAMATRKIPRDKLSGVWGLPGTKELVVVENGETVKGLDVKGEFAATEESLSAMK